MPNTTTATKATKLHPGRDAGAQPTAGPTIAGEPVQPTQTDQPRTALRGEALRNAAEESLSLLLDLGLARESIAFDIDRFDDLMSQEQRQRAAADLERIIGELAGGLARARMGGRVVLIVESEDEPTLSQQARDELGLGKAG